MRNPNPFRAPDRRRAARRGRPRWGAAFLVGVAALVGCGDAGTGDTRTAAPGATFHALADPDAGPTWLDVAEEDAPPPVPAPDPDDPRAYAPRPAPTHIRADAEPPERQDGVRFSAVHDPTIDAHVMPLRRNDLLGYGWGGAVFDADGDGDLDLFLGGVFPTLGCAFRNISTPGNIEFESVPGWCIVTADPLVSAVAFDADGDGWDELIVGGDGALFRVSFIDRRAITTDLFALLPRGSACAVASLLPYDHDLDGDPDLLVACAPFANETTGRVESRDDLVFTYDDEDDTLAPASTDLPRRLPTLAWAALDMGDDGLIDLFSVADTLSPPGQANLTLEPGGPLRRCDPTERCTFDRRQWTDRPTAWRSHMGFGAVYHAASGQELIYLTDWGPNGLLSLTDDPAETLDFAEATGAALTYVRDDLFSWGVAVDDFDNNGLDDLFVTQGVVPPESAEFARDHFDALLLQRSDGRFDVIGTPTGWQPAEPFPSGELGVARNRGIIKVDLDQDGRLELITAPHDGRYRVHSESDPPPRCALDPRSAYAPARMVGYAVRYTEDGPWHRRDTAGQVQFGTAPRVYTSAHTGWLRFPSGWVTPFDCAGDAAPLVIEEPRWAVPDVASSELLLTLTEASTTPGDAVDAAVRNDGDVALRTAVRDGDAWAVPRLEGDAAVMWRVDGRWLARWEEIP